MVLPDIKEIVHSEKKALISRRLVEGIVDANCAHSVIAKTNINIIRQVYFLIVVREFA